MDRLRRQTDMAHDRDIGTDDGRDRLGRALAPFDFDGVGVSLFHEAAGVREAALPPTVLVPNNPLVVVLPVCAQAWSAELHDRIVTSTARILVQRTNMEPPEPLS